MVITLISVMFLFTAPRFEGSLITTDTTKVVRWIINRAQLLRNDALTHRKRFVLIIETDLNLIWVASEDMDEETLSAARESAFEVPGNTDIVSVEFPGGAYDAAGEARINFYPGGYSDKAAIHLEDDEGNPTTIIIEPFLPNIKTFDERVSFNG